jgi:transcriptional regulator with XRE-family HTH domain
MLGIERTYWSRHENGRRSISLEVAALLVDRFGVTLDFIYLGHWAGVPFDLAQKMRRVEAEFATSTDETSLRGKSSSPIRV